MCVGFLIFGSLLWLIMQLKLVDQQNLKTSKVATVIVPTGHFIINTSQKIFPIISNWLIEFKTQLQQKTKF